MTLTDELLTLRDHGPDAVENWQDLLTRAAEVCAGCGSAPLEKVSTERLAALQLVEQTLARQMIFAGQPSLSQE